MNKVLVPSGFREKYKPLHRELFWETSEENLYMYNFDHWVLIAGKGKQKYSEAEGNLEIVFDEEDTDHEHPYIRLKDDIDINTMELGKFSTAARWKGTVKLGEVENTTFFPLVKYSLNSKELIGGKFLIQIEREDKKEFGIYTATVCGNEHGSIFGSDDQNVKCTVNRVTYTDNKSFVGFKTFSTLRTQYTYEEIQGEDTGVTSEIYFVINDKNNIYFQSTDGVYAKFTNRFDILSTGTNSAADDYGCHWYELKMEDFRRITGIPLTTGSNLDLYDNNSYVYFDIFINNQSQFSIDRVFITHERATAGDEDTIVSDGKVWCHNPYWLTPNDKSTVDVSDGFVFIDSIFTSEASNMDYTANVGIKIMDVYMVIPGGVTTITHTKLLYLPPDKITVWFNGWDTRDTKKFELGKEEDIFSSKTVARN